VINNDLIEQLNDSFLGTAEDISNWLHHDEVGATFGFRYIQGLMDCGIIFESENNDLILEFLLTSDSGEMVQLPDNEWEWQYSGEFDESYFLSGVMGEFQELIGELIEETLGELDAELSVKIKATIIGYQD
jgi:hypothetical protein